MEALETAISPYKEFGRKSRKMPLTRIRHSSGGRSLFPKNSKAHDQLPQAFSDGAPIAI
jgi:hypothetical protein